MNTCFVTQVIRSVEEVFDILLHLDVETGELKMKNRCEFIVIKSIAGNMNLIGNNALASVAIIFPEAFVLKIGNKIMPEPVSRINEVVIDLVGEITNMVAGRVKGKLEREGYLFNLSLPTIVLGREYLIAHLPQGPIIKTDIMTQIGSFVIETSFKGGQDFCPINNDIPEELHDILF